MRRISIPDLDNATGLIEFGLARTEMIRMWCHLFAMAVRDRATSVHWHPWREGEALSYIIRTTRYTLMRPPTELNTLTSAVAREFVVPGRIRSTIGRWLGRSVASRFICVNSLGPSEWCGVWWAIGSINGADFFRTDLGVIPIIEEYRPTLSANPFPDRRER